MKRVGLIGYGAIGKAIVASCHRHEIGGIEVVALLAKSARMDEAAQCLPDILVTDRIDIFLAARPDIVVEAAGHQSVQAHGEAVLRAGCEFHILSTGVFADEDSALRLTAAAHEGGGAIMIPSGALAGFDGLRALRAAGLETVTYVSVKPPRAWIGTPAADEHELASLTERRVIFEGSAREAALRFPRNANLAATVALAGLGFDRTRVQLIADPHSTGNRGKLIAEGRHGRIEATVAGSSDPDNPKTSAITAYSVVAALRNSERPVHFM